MSAKVSRGPSEGLAALLPEAKWSRVRRLSLIRREVREVLAPRALDLLWSRREQILEGGREIGGRAPTPGYFATVMITIDLMACRDLFIEAADVATALRVASLMSRNEDLHSRLEALVRPQLAALSQHPAGDLEIALEFRTRAEGSRILIDGDAMTSPV